MMKKSIILIWMLAVVLPLASFAQGVDFKSLTMQEALDAAMKEKKLVFVDFYTTWCGPCKKMASEVFTRDDVGTFFNRAFVNLKLDAEKGEGVEMAKKYKVSAYPTFVVLKADGTEVYRTTGARPAEEFLEKIKKGINPQWSPEALTRRYEKGERTPELVNEYALLQMEKENYDEGERVVSEYFDKLSDKRRVKPENFFLFSRYALNFKDVKADYVFANKDRLIKDNGKENVEKLMYGWLRQEIMPFVTVNKVFDSVVNPANWQRLKAKIENAGMNQGGMTELMNVAEARLVGDMKAYVEFCRDRFPYLESRDRFSILISLGSLKDEKGDVRQMAADLIRDNLGDMHEINERVLRSIMFDLEGKKEYRLRAFIEGVKKGKVTVSYFLKGKFERQDYDFDNHVINLSLGMKDTVTASVRLLCDELACPTARGNDYYPYVECIIVPGESAVMDVLAEKGKAANVKWKNGGPISHDYIRLKYDLRAPEEIAYNQLIMDNIIAGGDIRNYPNEFQASWDSEKKKIMTFIRESSESYIAVMKLLEHYIWFDENETEKIYHRFPSHVKSSPYGRALRQKLEYSKDYRTGMKAKDFEKKDMNGKTVSLKGLKGRYVLLDFWGSWCGPCRESHPHLKELHEKYNKQVVFINVAQENVKDLAEARRLWKAAVKEDGMTWTQILNNEGRKECDMVRLFNISSFPTKVLINPDGIVVSRMIGGMVDAGEVLEKELGKK